MIDLLARGPKNVVLKLGAKGSVLVNGEGNIERFAGHKVKVEDTTAAGDAFNAAFAVALLRGQTSPQSAQYACAVAGIAVSRYGAQPSMPTSTEVEEFIQLRR